MKVIDLLKNCDEQAYKEYMAECSEQEKLSFHLLRELKTLPSIRFSDKKCVFVPLYVPEFRDEEEHYDVLRFLDVFFIDPADPKKESYALLLTPLEEILGMDVWEKSLDLLSPMDMVSGLLSEFSFLGDSVEDIRKGQENMEREISLSLKDIEENKTVKYRDFSEVFEDIRKTLEEEYPELKENAAKRKEHEAFRKKIEEHFEEKNRENMKKFLEGFSSPL